MTVPGDGARAHATSTPRTVRVQLEIKPTDETIHGRLTIEGEQLRDFYGWLELINVLQSALNSCRAQPKVNR